MCIVLIDKYIPITLDLIVYTTNGALVTTSNHVITTFTHFVHYMPH